jgi:hypothetical protein
MNNTINLNLEVAAAMKAIAASNPPNWIRSLKSYRNGWVAAIGANVIDKDEFGPTVVSWCGHTYVRRCGENKKYGAAIWFSRPAGKSEAGEVTYVRLITFKKDIMPKAEPLPDYIKQALQ